MRPAAAPAIRRALRQHPLPAGGAVIGLPCLLGGSLSPADPCLGHAWGIPAGPEVSLAPEDLPGSSEDFSTI